MQTNEPTIDPSEYDASYYASHCGLRYERNDHWLTFFAMVADRIVTSLRPRTSLDVGCAHGFLVEALAARGVDASGFDFSDYAISQVHESVADRCWVGSAAEPIEGRYDLVTSIEMLEHLTPGDAQRAVANLCAASDTLLISTTPLDFVEPTHINVRPPEYWAALFAEHGFVRDLDYDAGFLTPWAALYRRSDAPLAAVVRAYERELWLARVERDELRGESKRLWTQLDERAAAADDELQRRLDDRTQELWNARDAVEGARAARGSALGQLGVARLEIAAMRAEHEEWRTKLHGLYEELMAARRELGDIKSSRAWKLAQAGALTAAAKRRLDR